MHLFPIHIVTIEIEINDGRINNVGEINNDAKLDSPIGSCCEQIRIMVFVDNNVGKVWMISRR